MPRKTSRAWLISNIFTLWRWPMRPPSRRRLIVVILSICAQHGTTSPLASVTGNAMRSKGASTAMLVIRQTVRVMVAKCGLWSTKAGRGLPANSTSRSAMITMSPRAKSAAGGPSVLPEDIISETVEEIEFFLRGRLGNQPGLARGFLGKAGGARVWHPDLQGAHPLRLQLVAAALNAPSIR